MMGCFSLPPAISNDPGMIWMAYMQLVCSDQVVSLCSCVTLGPLLTKGAVERIFGAYSSCHIL